MSNQDKHIIFLDTSVFESENFFKGRNINHIAQLAEDDSIELKITDIVYNEIKQRIYSNLRKSQLAFKKAKSHLDSEAKILKNLNAFDQFYPLPKIDIDELYKTLVTNLDKFISDHKIEIIDSSTSDVKEVFKAYFESEPPFHNEKKKSEFPDAFTFNTIEKWTKANNKKVFLISKDSDFDELSNQNIDCSQNLSSLLDQISREIDEKQTELIESVYEASTGDIVYALENNFDDKLADAVFNELENDPFYEDVDVIGGPNDVNAEIDIAVINEIVINSSFSYEVESNISFSIEVEFTDLNSAIYDKETGIWYGEERVTMVKEYSVNVISIAEFSYDLKDNNGFYYKMDEFEIRSIDEQ